MEGVGLASPTQGITNKRINSLSPPPALRSTLQLLAALSARVMEVPRLARSTGFPSTESGLEGTPALCTRAPPHGAPSLRHTGRETRPRDAAAPHTSPPRLTCVPRRRAARCRKRRWGSCRPSSPMALVWRETRESQFCPEFLFKKVRYLSFPRYSTKIYFLQPKPPTNILAVRDSQEDTPLRRATYSEFPPSSLCADHGLRKSETRAFTHTNQFVRSWLFLTCFM